VIGFNVGVEIADGDRVGEIVLHDDAAARRAFVRLIAETDLWLACAAASRLGVRSSRSQNSVLGA
jgi:hypothetical protein